MLVSICEDDQRNRGEIEALCREWGALHQDCPLAQMNIRSNLSSELIAV